MKRYLTKVLFLIAVFAMAACDPVEKNLKGMESLVADAEAHGDQYTDSDWDQFVKQYDAYQESLSKYRSELTQEDFRQFGQISARYQKVILGCSMNILKSTFEAGRNFLEGYMDEMGGGLEGESPDDSFMNAVDGIMDETESILE